jgi:hypothetical protein
LLASQPPPPRSPTKTLSKDRALQINSTSISAKQLQALDVQRIADPGYWTSLEQKDGDQSFNSIDTITTVEASQSSASPDIERNASSQRARGSEGDDAPTTMQRKRSLSSSEQRVRKGSLNPLQPTGRISSGEDGYFRYYKS